VHDLWERPWQTRRRTALFEVLPDRIPAAQRDHRAMVKAIRKGDAVAAGAAMERRRESTLDAWLEALGLTRS
jgi:DNA-binding FadR family transcriptional regulator